MGFYKELDLFPPYCRVSTDTEKQLSSYETQVAYYVRLYLKAPGLGVCIYMPTRESQGQIPKTMPDLTWEMDELRQQHSAFTQAELMRKDTLSRVWEIERMLRERDVVKAFDEDLFAALVEQIRVVSLVEVVFVLKAGGHYIQVREVL
ncbi:hypothetical protein Tph_c07740 [Thermacetogenium phaeum DSM 12270]|jgi:hypothetical protein|uniref:Uncharacterized protein n=1 Tax=Thermacetogenium phaeum (strain ATCC BAA-254 / DSM 26808 / PB) TaxID=1089553 RepID=K4LDD7_THEPS|nr:hypothetical protein [Thermacetogenium phaeum]AFV11006.1 hypothetical protein Tph_c07740 [Thermacetogenium phaeum DSM 12270]